MLPWSVVLITPNDTNFAPLWYFRLAIPPTSSAYRSLRWGFAVCCCLTWAFLIVHYIGIYSQWKDIPLVTIDSEKYRYWSRYALVSFGVVSLPMVTFRPFGGYVIYYLIEERCVTVFSGNPEWLCSFVFPVSSNCHVLGFFLLCSCLGFNLDFANAKLYWFFYIVRSSLVGFFGKTWIVLSFYNWIQFKVELFLQLCWPVHPWDIA